MRVENMCKYDTRLKMAKTGKVRWFGHMARAKETTANTILRGNVLGGRCSSFMILTATVSEIFGGQTSSSI